MSAIGRTRYVARNLASTASCYLAAVKAGNITGHWDCTKRFTEEFKIEAAKQITERGHAVAEMAGWLGGIDA